MTPSQSLFAELNLDFSTLALDQITHYTAVQYHLTCQDDPPPNATPLKQVECYLESFYHLSQVQDWQRATLILTTVPNPQLNEELHHQLGLWGYWEEQKHLYDTLLHKLNPACDTVCWNGLGHYYDTKGQYDQSLEAHQAHLTLAQTLHDTKGEWMALTGVGNAHKGKGDWTKAKTAYQQALDLLNCQDTTPENQGGKAMILGSLASIAYGETQYEQAQQYAQDCLTLGQTLNQPSIVTQALNLLGDIQTQIGHPNEALPFHQESWTLAKTYNNREHLCDVLLGFGNAYFALDDLETALDWYQQSLTLAQELGEPSLEGRALRGLGMVFYSLDCFEQSKQQFQRYLDLAQQTKSKRGLLQAWRGLAYAEDALDRLEMAVFYEELCLRLAETLEDWETVATARAYLGYGYLNFEEYELAKEHLEKALQWQLDHDTPSQVTMTYYNLAKTYWALGDGEGAKGCIQQGQRLAKRHASHLLRLYRQLQQEFVDSGELIVDKIAEN